MKQNVYIVESLGSFSCEKHHRCRRVKGKRPCVESRRKDTAKWRRLSLRHFIVHFRRQHHSTHSKLSTKILSYPLYSKVCLGIALLWARACSLSLSLAKLLFPEETAGKLGGPGEAELFPPIMVRGLNGGESVVKPFLFNRADAIFLSFALFLGEAGATRWNACDSRVLKSNDPQP